MRHLIVAVALFAFIAFFGWIALGVFTSEVAPGWVAPAIGGAAALAYLLVNVLRARLRAVPSIGG